MNAPLPTSTHDPSILLRVRGLRKAWGASVAVDGLDLDVPRGSVFGLLGPNGAGKSTTFGMLCGWLRPDAGTVEVLGLPPTRLWQRPGRVAALPQDASFPAQVSVLEQLAHFARLSGVPRAAATDEARRVLREVGLQDASHLRGSQLSHGMHKRVGLAQALVGDPDLLLLDEPTSGLDPRTSREIKDRIAALAPRRTVLLSSHNLSEVQEICTHGAILDHGRLTIAGPITDLTRRGAEYTILLRGDLSEARRIVASLGHHVVTTTQDADIATLQIRPPDGSDLADMISECLRALLDHDLRILEVQRGTSLERAFLELTAPGRTRPSAAPPAP
jgi:ABC-2 type transport system ATP-binding protein